MAKKADKEIPEEIPIEEAPPVIQELVAAQVEETPKQRRERLAREDYQRRNLEAIAEREEILRRNKVLKPDEPFTMDPAAGNAQCCI